jgi:2-polyprenyl-3-methyl-5-hydroxy-6-metoxy-1,4-benzoquinol methylase
MQSYVDKSESYFSHARKEIEPLLPQHCGRVLEIGCGSGATLNWLRQGGRASHTVGIEISLAAAEIAQKQVDEVHCLDFEKADLPSSIGRFDVILCLDVLEHLFDPWKTLNRLVTHHLAESGTLVVSLPNVQHYSVVLPLLFRGRWEYENAGLLDRTHVRFFTRATALHLLADPMLLPPQTLALNFGWRSRKGIFNKLTFGLFQDLLIYQYYFAAQKKQDCDMSVYPQKAETGSSQNELSRE